MDGDDLASSISFAITDSGSMIGGVCTLKRFDTLRPLRSSKGKMFERNLRPILNRNRQHEIATEGAVTHTRRAL